MAFTTLRVNLTSLLEGQDTERGHPNRPRLPSERFINKDAFVGKQLKLAEEYATEYLTVSRASTIPQVIKEGKSPFTGNSVVGGDAPVKSLPPNLVAFEHGITNAFDSIVHSYTMSSVEDRSRAVNSRRMPILGDMAITIPRYIISSSALEDGSTRVAESAVAHGIYYTSVPSNNPIELITGVPDDFPKPFVPFMVLQFHVDHNMIDSSKMNEYNQWMKSSVKRIVRIFMEIIRKHELEQDKKNVLDFTLHSSGWLLQYFSHTRLYFNSKYPTKLETLFTCPVFRDNSLNADYIKLADVMGFDKQTIQNGLLFNRPVHVSF